MSSDSLYSGGKHARQPRQQRLDLQGIASNECLDTGLSSATAPREYPPVALPIFRIGLNYLGFETQDDSIHKSVNGAATLSCSEIVRDCDYQALRNRRFFEGEALRGSP